MSSYKGDEPIIDALDGNKETLLHRWGLCLTQLLFKYVVFTLLIPTRYIKSTVKCKEKFGWDESHKHSSTDWPLDHSGLTSRQTEETVESSSVGIFFRQTTYELQSMSIICCVWGSFHFRKRNVLHLNGDAIVVLINKKRETPSCLKFRCAREALFCGQSLPLT